MLGFSGFGNDDKDRELDKFFNFLTKKFPVPFERVGWCSREFWVGVFERIIKKFKKNA